MTEDETTQADAEPVVPDESAKPVSEAPESTQPNNAQAADGSQTAQMGRIEPLPEPPQAASVSVSSQPTEIFVGKDILIKARATIQNRKRIKLEKILEYVNAKNHITNDEVEKLLHVSDATATRYLSQLDSEGKIKQIGKTGKAVTYTKP